MLIFIIISPWCGVYLRHQVRVERDKERERPTTSEDESFKNDIQPTKKCYEYPLTLMHAVGMAKLFRWEYDTEQRPKDLPTNRPEEEERHCNLSSHICILELGHNRNRNRDRAIKYEFISYRKIHQVKDESSSLIDELTVLWLTLVSWDLGLRNWKHIFQISCPLIFQFTRLDE